MLQPAMHPAKTEKGRTALASRDPALSPADRRLLILADGKRAADELAALLGPDTPAALARLAELDFLTAAPPPAIAAPAPEAAPVAVEAPPPAPISPVPTRVRRSIAVAKLYMVDRLTLMRHTVADELSSLIHAANSTPEIMQAISTALRFVADTSGPRHAHKIAQHLRDIVPEPWDADMDTAIATYSTDRT